MGRGFFKWNIKDKFKYLIRYKRGDNLETTSDLEDKENDKLLVVKDSEDNFNLPTNHYFGKDYFVRIKEYKNNPKRKLDWLDNVTVGKTCIERFNPLKSRWLYRRRYKIKNTCYTIHNKIVSYKAHKVPLFLLTLIVILTLVGYKTMQTVYSANGRQFVKIVMVDTDGKKITAPGWDKSLSWQGNVSRDGEWVDLKSKLRLDTEGDGYKFSYLQPTDFREISGTKIKVYLKDTVNNYPTINAVYEKVEKNPDNYIIVRSVYQDDDGNYVQLPGDIVKDHSWQRSFGQDGYLKDGEYLDLEANGLISHDLGSMGFEYIGLSPSSGDMGVTSSSVIMKTSYNTKTPGIVYAVYKNKNNTEPEIPKGKALVFVSWWLKKDDGGLEQVNYQGINNGGSVETDGAQRMLVDLEKPFEVDTPGLRYKNVKLYENKGVDTVKGGSLKFIIHDNDGYKGKRSLKIIVTRENCEGVFEFYQDLDDKGNILHTSTPYKRDVKVGQKFRTSPYAKIKNGYEYVETRIVELQYDHDIDRLPLDYFTSDGKHPAEGKEFVRPYYGYAFLHVYKLAKLVPDKEIEVHVADFAVKDNKVIHINTWNGSLVDWIGRNTDENGGRGMLLKTGKDGKVRGFVKSPTNGFWPDKDHPHNLIVCKQLNADGNPESSWSGLGVRREFSPPIPANGYEMEFDSSRETWYVHFFWDFNDNSVEVMHINEKTGEEIHARTYPKVEVGKTYTCADWQEVINGYKWSKCEPENITIEKGKKYVIKEYYSGSSVVVHHIDEATGVEIADRDYPKVEVGKSYDCSLWKKKIDNYKWEHCEPTNLVPKAGEDYKIIQYYKKQKVENKIIFTPDHTKWTNEGKIDNGVGKYKVNVKYIGDNPISTQSYCSRHHWGTCRECDGWDDKGKCTSHTTYPCVKFCGGDYETIWGLKGINLKPYNTDLSTNYAKGLSDDFYIIRENESIRLTGAGDWGSSPDENYHDRDQPPCHEDAGHSENLKKPPIPKGEAGLYHIDWSKPIVNIRKANSDWVNKPMPNKVDITIDDKLSGLDTVDIYVADASHYKRDAREKYVCKEFTGISNHGERHKKWTITLDDGIYAIRVVAKDVAGNVEDITEKVYYLDGTPPEVSFKPQPGIFPSERHPSEHEPDCPLPSFYSDLSFSDNLSGVAKVETAWTYNNKISQAKWENFWAHKPPHTLTDNWQEKFTEKVEKPVGDDLYLHARVTDMAGNVTIKTFGPYEDPIKLRDFKVIDIRDPMWDTFFRDEDGKKKEDAFFEVAKLPIDKYSNPVFTNAYTKIGYSYYFELKSEYLYRDEDKIEITPKFYHVDKDGGRKEVDCYYEFEGDKFTKVGTKGDAVKLHIVHRGNESYIGELDLLRLTSEVRSPFNGVEWRGEGGWYPKEPSDVQYCSGKEQTWYGKYLLPETSKFVPKGEKPVPENILKEGNIIINFQIEAFKNGEESKGSNQTYLYVPEQWKEEGGPKNGDYKEGDIMVHDSYDDNGIKHNRRDDLMPHNTH